MCKTNNQKHTPVNCPVYNVLSQNKIYFHHFPFPKIIQPAKTIVLSIPPPHILRLNKIYTKYNTKYLFFNGWISCGGWLYIKVTVLSTRIVTVLSTRLQITNIPYQSITDYTCVMVRSYWLKQTSMDVTTCKLTRKTYYARCTYMTEWKW